MTPYIKDDKTAGCIYTLPCGKCPNCLKRRVSGWSFRLMQEEKHCQSAMFLTLTYDTKHVPISKNGYMTLNKRDCQLFFKRLRKAHTTKQLNPNYVKGKTNRYIRNYPTGQSPLKYYLAGEYGGITSRPHYHIILFNARLELLQPAWHLGQIHYGNVSGASVGYCLKYISKAGTIPMHKNDDRTPEFSLFSKGLGSKYLTQSSIKYHKTDPAGRNHLTIEDGKKIAMPRYYKQKIYDETDNEQIKQAAQARHEEALNKALNDPDYNQNRYNEQQAQIAAFRKLKSKSNKDKL